MKYMIMIYSNPVTWAHPTFLHQREQLVLALVTAGATLAARAALSQLMLHIPPCLECARRAEQLARDAIKADPTAPAAHLPCPAPQTPGA